jgi:UDP-N-acetylmuramate dehydrogenase
MSLISQDVALKNFNTFGISAVANNYVKVTDQAALIAALKWGDEEGMIPFVLGGGSNVLFTQPNYPFVIHNGLLGIEEHFEENGFVSVKVGGGVVWQDLVAHCIENDWGGIENLSWIPGTVGAAPMQNIGAYGVEIKEVFESLEAVNMHSLETKVFDERNCQFGYRESVFKKELEGKYFITSVTLKLTMSDHKINTSYGAIQSELAAQDISIPTIRQVSEAVIAIRSSKLPDPSKIANAGSFFKNPLVSQKKHAILIGKHPEMPSYPAAEGFVKVPAGWLIEQCGWKGKQEGNVGVPDKQALVLVNLNNGSGDEIETLATNIQSSVAIEFGISLEMEVNVV